MKIGKVATPSAYEQEQPTEPPKFAISREVKSSLLSDRGNLWIFLFSLGFVLAEVCIIGFRFRNLPPVIPIFYSKTWGSAIISNNIFIWLLPAIAVFFIVINFFLYFMFFRENKQSFSTNRQSLSTNKQSFSTNRQSLSTNRFLAKVLFFASAIAAFTTFWGAMKIVTLLA